MKKILFIVFTVLALKGFSQASYDINFMRTSTKSQVDAEADSLFKDKVEIRIFETGAAVSVDLKFYDFANDVFSEVHNSTITVASVDDTLCSSDYCSYMFNSSVLIINLGTHSATNGKHKVYLKINGAQGKTDLVREAEL